MIRCSCNVDPRSFPRPASLPLWNHHRNACSTQHADFLNFTSVKPPSTGFIGLAAQNIVVNGEYTSWCLIFLAAIARFFTNFQQWEKVTVVYHEFGPTEIFFTKTAVFLHSRDFIFAFFDSISVFFGSFSAFLQIFGICCNFLDPISVFCTLWDSVSAFCRCVDSVFVFWALSSFLDSVCVFGGFWTLSQFFWTHLRYFVSAPPFLWRCCVALNLYICIFTQTVWFSECGEHEKGTVRSIVLRRCIIPDIFYLLLPLCDTCTTFCCFKQSVTNTAKLWRIADSQCWLSTVFEGFLEFLSFRAGQQRPQPASIIHFLPALELRRIPLPPLLTLMAARSPANAFLICKRGIFDLF